MAEASNQIFLPWVQPGLVAGIPDQATDTLTAAQPAVVTLPVKLVVNNDTVNKVARLYGPGDVTGIDPLQVIRVEPRHLTPDFEPNYFPAIEFDRPDFPWLFTPAKADAQGCLRPWLCLVVIRKQPGVELRPAGLQPLPTLEIKAPAVPTAELPDLSESHLWAHTQITGASRADLKVTLAAEPAKSASRLLCPRRLVATTDYLACVVPAFEVGRLAGLGLPVTAEDEKTLAPAWQFDDTVSAETTPPPENAKPSEITLPVYYSWEFRTGAGGDFEELVRRLEPRLLPPEVGKRPMDISRPGFPIVPQPQPGAPGTVLGLEGALRPVNSSPDEWPAAVSLPFQDELAKIVNTPWKLATQGGDTPLLAPPIYGCWHAAVHEVGTRAEPPPPIWLDDLNLDPRNRATAALGTRVIQTQQEQLMASAWEQLGDIQRVNQRLRQAQLARAVNRVYYAKSFARFSPESFFQIVAPAQSRVMVEERPPFQPADAPPIRMLLAQRLEASLVPTSVISAPLRRLARPRGTMNRQFERTGVAGVGAMFSLFTGSFNISDTPSGGTTPQDRGAVTIEQISQTLADTLQNHGGVIFNPGPPPGFFFAPPEYRQMLDNFRLSHLTGVVFSDTVAPPSVPAGMLEIAKSHQNYLSQTFTTPKVFVKGVMISAGDLKSAALASIDPERSVRAAALASFTIDRAQPQAADALEPIMDAPDFPQPMYEALRDLSQDYLLPGLEHVPPNTVQLLQTNAEFIESFMVGLNAEMGRELLWRGYPTDQRGTYFRQFWDAVGGSADVDIPPITEWDGHRLGENVSGAAASGDKLVLLIRGELLRRYPGTIIYAVKAATSEEDRKSPTDPSVVERVTVRAPSPNPADESHPIFRGTLEPDVSFVGFDLTPDEVVGGQGWYFVLQQQPTEPRFGMDDDPFGPGESGTVPPLRTWDDLNWAHVASSAEELSHLAHVSVGKVQLVPTEPARGTWGRNSAHMAYITRQKPARVAIHATELIR